MISSSIIKLIDEAILPAATLILAKILGFFLVSYFLQIPTTIKYGGLLGILPSIQFQNIDNYIVAENYSNVAMFTVVALGCFFVVTRAHFFHESHIHPNLHSKLVNLNLESLIAPTYHLYHQAAIWVIFLWLTTGFLLISTIFLNVTSPIISITALVISANFSWVLARDVEQEIRINKESV